MKIPHPLSHLIFHVDGETARLFDRNWRETVGACCHPVFYTAFGDWILTTEDGRCVILDLLESGLRDTGRSVDEFVEHLSRSDEARDEWLLEGLVIGMTRSGRTLRDGEVYAFAVHPRLGAPVDVSNVVIEKLADAQAQLSALMTAVPE